MVTQCYCYWSWPVRIQNQDPRQCSDQCKCSIPRNGLQNRSPAGVIDAIRLEITKSGIAQLDNRECYRKAILVPAQRKHGMGTHANTMHCTNILPPLGGAHGANAHYDRSAIRYCRTIHSLRLRSNSLKNKNIRRDIPHSVDVVPTVCIRPPPPF